MSRTIHCVSCTEIGNSQWKEMQALVEVYLQSAVLHLFPRSFAILWIQCVTCTCRYGTISFCFGSTHNTKDRKWSLAWIFAWDKYVILEHTASSFPGSTQFFGINGLLKFTCNADGTSMEPRIGKKENGNLKKRIHWVPFIYQILNIVLTMKLNIIQMIHEMRFFHFNISHHNF